MDWLNLRCKYEDSEYLSVPKNTLVFFLYTVEERLVFTSVEHMICGPLDKFSSFRSDKVCNSVNKVWCQVLVNPTSRHGCGHVMQCCVFASLFFCCTDNQGAKDKTIKTATLLLCLFLSEYMCLGCLT